ncbi:MAG: response regulator transcription factor [Holophagales bacterium]|nr:response regulator transcription factor [Holophagales bacterium]
MIVDDHALFRDSLRGLLASKGIDVAGEAASGEEAVRMAQRLRPDVVLMDLAMPEMDGIEATRRICQELEGVKVIVLTASHDDEDLLEAIRAGAEGYLPKDLNAKEVLAYLRGLAIGQPALPPQAARRLMSELARPRSDERFRDPAKLTSREKEVLEAMVEGVTSNRALARHFGVSQNTVKFHVRNILDKLDLHDRAQAVSVAIRRGIVRTDPRRANSPSAHPG